MVEKRFDVAYTIKDNDIINREWIYENIFNFTKDDIDDIEDGMVYDKKFALRLEQIEQEGNDPWESGVVKDTNDESGEEGSSDTSKVTMSIPHKSFEDELETDKEDISSVGKPEGNKPSFGEAYISKLMKNPRGSKLKRTFLKENVNTSDQMLEMADDIEQFINNIDKKIKKNNKK